MATTAMMVPRHGSRRCNRGFWGFDKMPTFLT